ncbi:hypothetical protein [Candidatus Thiosymbion oneisti]|uniref:hypothetical protein n=1 Tax=Candidatus Thiosymbion oneisti TaxID=589554 RepID=UPI00105DF42F|nr:hypothetical protein [Candidatus Thiosymbion oneisti]
MRKLTIIGLVLVAVLLALALAMLAPFDIGEVTVSFRFHSEAKRALKRLGLPEDATEVSDITVEGPDGTMPEIATRSFISGGTVDALHRFFHEKCDNQGFFHPSDDLLNLQPETLCEGRRPSGAFEVLLFTECADNSCFVYIEVRHFIM